MELLLSFNYKEIIIEIIMYGFPTVALLLSILSFFNSRNANIMQTKVNELEEKLKRMELAEKELQYEDEKKANVEARIYNISKGNYKLKIWNSGKATAYDVDFDIEERMKGMIIKDKVPYEYLETNKSFEEIVIHANGIPRKFKITTKWKNKENNFFSKEQIISY